MRSFHLPNVLETVVYLTDFFQICLRTSKREFKEAYKSCKMLFLCTRDHHFSEIMKSIDSIKTMSGPVYDLGQDSKHSCNEVARTVDRIKTLAYPGDLFSYS